jgi:hypothetical protein
MTIQPLEESVEKVVDSAIFLRAAKRRVFKERRP